MPCCPACAQSLESAIYCPGCAESIRNGITLPVKRSVPGLRTPGDESHWIILVARDEPDLLAHLVRAFAEDTKVEIIMDRRKDFSRNPPGMEDRLRIHGAALVRRPPRD